MMRAVLLSLPLVVLTACDASDATSSQDADNTAGSVDTAMEESASEPQDDAKDSASTEPAFTIACSADYNLHDPDSGESKRGTASFKVTFDPPSEKALMRDFKANGWLNRKVEDANDEVRTYYEVGDDKLSYAGLSFNRLTGKVSSFVYDGSCKPTDLIPIPSQRKF